MYKDYNMTQHTLLMETSVLIPTNDISRHVNDIAETIPDTEFSETARSSKSHKVVLSSDCSLQLDYMKLESLVIVDQHATVNTFPGLVHTARHTTRVCNTRSRWSNHLELAVEGGTNDWGEVVTR